MLGLFQGLSRQVSNAVLRGGPISDGTWSTLTTDPGGTWAQVGSTDWDAWDAIGDS